MKSRRVCGKRSKDSDLSKVRSADVCGKAQPWEADLSKVRSGGVCCRVQPDLSKVRSWSVGGKGRGNRRRSADLSKVSSESHSHHVLQTFLK
jgi:hypothetical protein